ncbi:MULTISPECIES: tRNA (adenosine(37)-N6)-threonylcarbamoyltransferase complex ATPase subunit type 1 TsaE [unclassified Lentimicrobium]|uniref:tRNA (adenosine(37)-N6)-threonylcarbamoyltransferase complex ATPase subunit type 1 TsaE n=1 Tax=unclassified Lentimicrobium TaxID=2677434 RepID=UPI001554CA47|nr:MULTISPECIES: tRNA (adenosine(37)-N6)-threonylcarbamoyltransferase complex ATPase subunit type 1 TsaE [unclassified Lentimicrobium]NPD46481.1 tRNA (adenosine(37)-N6)-threonylcarbamoyltransferase complex ATPase subunit type 1 TsaE [Lentimicrobium sp. S6]NPD85987.1 tRNA (adenosine(37)-N6)-threonylcarbamoyltransferase complex ATPase subunit type 1 TsaE [Lentimicrobium sp. L6]
MSKYEFKAEGPSDLSKIAQSLIKSLGEHKIVAFKGEMGAGKTTFIKAICEFLQVDGIVNSPTFSIINQYDTLKGDIVFHFDFYRLETYQEALDIGIYDYLESGNLCLMEWPEKVEKLLPEECVYLKIKEDELTGDRIIKWEV